MNSIYHNQIKCKYNISWQKKYFLIYIYVDRLMSLKSRFLNDSILLTLRVMWFKSSAWYRNKTTTYQTHTYKRLQVQRILSKTLKWRIKIHKTILAILAVIIHLIFNNIKSVKLFLHSASCCVGSCQNIVLNKLKPFKY